MTGKPAVSTTIAGNDAAKCMHTGVFDVHTGATLPNIQTIRVDIAAKTMNFDLMFMVFKLTFMVLVPMFMVFKPMFMVFVPKLMVLVLMFMVFVPMFMNIGPMFMVFVPMLMNFGRMSHTFEAKRRDRHFMI